VSTQLLLLLGFTVFAGACVQGVVGFGLHLLALPVLALQAPTHVPQVLLLMAGPAVLWMAVKERRAMEWDGIGWLLVGRVLGTVAAVGVLSWLSAQSLQILFGVLTLLAVVLLASPRLDVPFTRLSQGTAGGLSGLMATTAGLGGPPLALLYAGRSGPVLRANLSTVFVFGNVLSVAAVASVGRLGMTDLTLAATLLLPMAAGLAVSRALLQLGIDRHLKVTVLLVSGASGALLLWQAM
jgi:uncharacterized protein